jgi:hypothetical protein
MDLPLFFGVVARYKRLLIGGVLLAGALAILAYGTPGFSDGRPIIKPRSSEIWDSEAELIVTREGSTEATRAPATGAPTSAQSAGEEEGYFSTLAPIYAAVANGDVVREQLRLMRVPGTVKAAEVVATASDVTLPLITLTSSAPTATDAGLLTQRASSVLRNYVAAEQAHSGAPAAHQIKLQVVKSGLPPTLAKGRSVTAPMLVFVAVALAFLALAFVLENLNPRTAAAMKRVPEQGALEAVELKRQPGDNGYEEPATELAPELGALSVPREGTAAWTPHSQLGEAQR